MGDVSIPYYLQIDYSGFNRIIDLLGGVWVDIDHPMHYDDNAGNYHFHKEPGRYLLKGQEALFYVRFRGPTGDKGRIMRQQEFVRNMMKRLANPLMVFKVPELMSVVFSSVHTNLSFWDLIGEVCAARRIRARDIGFYILPGIPRGLYLQLKKEAVHQLAARVILGQKIKDPMMDTIVPQSQTITINVWNASGRKGMAYQVTRALRRCGYDVVDWGTYAAEQIPTRVIDRKGSIANAQAVANSLGVESYHSEPNAKAMVDVEVIIGRDYEAGGAKE